MNSKRLIGIFLFALINVALYAKKIPDNLLSTNIGVVYFEFYHNENAAEELALSVDEFNEMGFNVVAAHNISNPYNMEMALYDMEGKDVKYILYIFNKRYIYKLSVMAFEDFAKKSISMKSIFRLAANSLTKMHNKTERKLNSYQRKNLIENTPNLSAHYVDTFMYKDQHKEEINYLIDKRNIADHLTSYDYEGLPVDLGNSKIAFVRFDKMDTPNFAFLTNGIAKNGLRGYEYGYEVFNSYDDYLKRKDEFKYRILFTSQNLVFIRKKQYYRQNHSSRSNINPGIYYRTKTEQVDKQLFAVILRNEKTGEIFKCTDHDWLHKSLREFVNRTSK
jgi:hypothetical protein